LYLEYANTLAAMTNTTTGAIIAKRFIKTSPLGM